MYEAMGRLHRAIVGAASTVALPEPGVATYATPQQLRAFIATTAAAVEGDEHAARLAADVRAMIEPLERQWTPPEQLPQHLVHGDVRLGNVARTVRTANADDEVAYFDFGFAARRPRV